MPFLLLLSSLQFRENPNRRSIRFAKRTGTLLASFSFTLYVIHVPFLTLLQHIYPPLRHGHLSPHDLAHLGIYCAMLGAIVVLAYLFHLPFEAQTYRVRSRIKAKSMAPSRARTAHAGGVL